MKDERLNLLIDVSAVSIWTVFMIDLSRGCLSRLILYLWFCMFWGIFRHKLCLRCFTLIIMSVTCQKGWHLKAMTKRTFLAELSFRTWHHADSSLQWSCTAQEVFDGDIDGESSEESPKFTEGFDYLYPLSTQWVMESLTICHLIHLHHQHLPACLWLTMFFFIILSHFFATLMESENVLLKQKWKHPCLKLCFMSLCWGEAVFISLARNGTIRRREMCTWFMMLWQWNSWKCVWKKYFYCDDTTSYISILSKNSLFELIKVSFCIGRADWSTAVGNQNGKYLSSNMRNAS